LLGGMLVRLPLERRELNVVAAGILTRRFGGLGLIDLYASSPREPDLR